MILFTIDRVLLIDFAEILAQDANHDLIEAFFDITFCYFPITFRPPPDDPYGITSQDLKIALRGCLTANPLLAPHAMPLLLEKLSATGGAAKRDTLETLKDALPIYGRAATQAHQSSLWENLKIEILHATDRETAQAAQDTLVSMLAVLYTIPEPVDPPAGLAPKIMAEMLKELESPEKVLAAPAASIVACLVTAGASTAYLAVYGALERVLELFKDPEEISQRAPILSHISAIVKAMRSVYEDQAGDPLAKPNGIAKAVKNAAAMMEEQSEKKVDFVVEHASQKAALKEHSQRSRVPGAPPRSYQSDRKPLDPFRDQLLASLHNGIRSASYRANALSVFVHLCHIPDFLTPQELDYLAEAVNELLVESESGPQTDEVRSLAMDALMELAKINTRTLEQTTLPLLLEKLPDQMPAYEANVMDSGKQNGSSASQALSKGEIRERTAIRRSLGAISRFGMHSDLFDILIVKLLTKFDLAVAPTCKTEKHRAANVGYARGLISSFFTIVQEKEKRGDRDLGKYALNSIPRLLSTMLAHVLQPQKQSLAPVSADQALIRDVGSLLMLFSRSLSVEKQKDLARRLRLAIEEGNISELLEQPRYKSAAGSTPFAPIFSSSGGASPRADQREIWYLLVSLQLPLKKEVGLPFSGDLELWTRQQLEWFASVQSALQFEACALSLASSINKQAPEPLPDSIIALLDDFFIKNVQQGPDNRRVLSLRCFLTVLKGIAIRNSKSTEQLLNRALSLCEDQAIGREAARSLEILAKDDAQFLTKENGHTVRLLHRQRLFSALLPRVIEGYRSATSASDPRQSVYLVALTSLLPHMPKSTTNERLKDLFVLLIRALDLPDEQTRASAANTIAIAVITAHIEKRKAEEQEVLSKTRRVTGGSSADFTTSNTGTQIAITLAEDHIGSLLARLLAMIEPAKNLSEVSQPLKVNAYSRVNTFSGTLTVKSDCRTQMPDCSSQSYPLHFATPAPHSGTADPG